MIVRLCGTACHATRILLHAAPKQLQATTALLMDIGCEALYGNGKANRDWAGLINSGQVLTVQVDMDAGALKFWVDGKRHGPGWTSGVTGPLRRAVFGVSMLKMRGR